MPGVVDAPYPLPKRHAKNNNLRRLQDRAVKSILSLERTSIDIDLSLYSPTSSPVAAAASRFLEHGLGPFARTTTREHLPCIGQGQNDAVASASKEKSESIQPSPDLRNTRFKEAMKLPSLLSSGRTPVRLAKTRHASYPSHPT